MRFRHRRNSTAPAARSRAGSASVCFEITDGNRVIPALVDSVLTVVVIVLVAWIAATLARRYSGDSWPAWSRRTAAHRRDSSQDSAIGQVAWPRRSPAPIGIANEPDPRREARIDSISTVVESTATVIIWTIAGITALGELGVNLAPLIAGAGIAGVALGFGAQSLVKDCIAGLFMLLEDQYGIGESSTSTRPLAPSNRSRCERPSCVASTARCGACPTVWCSASATDPSSGRWHSSTSASPMTATTRQLGR